MSRLKRGEPQEVPEQDESFVEDPAFMYFGNVDVNFQKTISTGLTLLDLALSGKRTRYGGLPGGIIAELFGPSASGKTALMAEICANVEASGGRILIGDPERRFDKEYAKLTGLHIAQENYYVPDTPGDVFKAIMAFKPTGPDIIDCIANDSLAALVASAEIEGTKKSKKKEGGETDLIQDKMGGMKPREMQALMRKIGRIITKGNILCIFTNQLIDTMQMFGPSKTTPGGNAIRFFASVRIEIKQTGKIDEKVSLIHGEGEKARRVEYEDTIGIEGDINIVKNSLDDPYRTAPFRLLFNHGFDDIGTNLQWLKSVTGDTTFSGYQSLSEAIRAIEKAGHENDLRERTVDMWHLIKQKFAEKTARKPKQR